MIIGQLVQNTVLKGQNMSRSSQSFAIYPMRITSLHDPHPEYFCIITKGIDPRSKPHVGRFQPVVNDNIKSLARVTSQLQDLASCSVATPFLGVDGIMLTNEVCAKHRPPHGLTSEP
jgi:hypothetical protein